ncbi:MAG: 50S ribosomal protein L23 [Methylophilaceae bacterium]|jgi:large subunit ribosomal protein L23|nr:50S ribosomal protein L23 [Methylophilaceae bacterium]
MSELSIKNSQTLNAILAPQITEKATFIADKYNQVAFKVRKNATKDQVKQAIELMFKVEVTAVNLLNMKGKTKRRGNNYGKRADWKKAYVSLKPGQEINFVGD